MATILLRCEECDAELENVEATDLDPSDARRMSSALFQREYTDDPDARPDDAETPMARVHRWAMQHRHDE